MVMSLPSPKVVGTSDPGDKWPETVIIKNNKHDITWQGGGGGDCVSGSDIGLTGFLVACEQGGFQSGRLHLQTPGYPKGKGAFSWQSG